MLRLLLLLGTGSALRVITRSMIRTPGDLGLPVEYHPVPLRTKEDGFVTAEQGVSGRSFDLPQEVEVARTTTTEEPQDSSGLVSTTTEEPQDTPEDRTPAEAPRRITKLYPVSGLWTDPDQDRQLMEPDLWGIIRTAYYCLFAGFDCFSSRVFPLVQSFMGYQPHYPYPRNGHTLRESQGAVMPNLLKELLLGLLLVNLPWLGGLGLASGKAFLTSVLGTTQPYYM